MATGCATATNFPDPSGPRYAGLPAPARTDGAGGDTLHIVSFNIEGAERIDSALAVLTRDPGVRDADVVLLQEMNAEGTERIARALGMGWVYYPARLRGDDRRGFGNAVLSSWPIVDDEKLVLPHRAVFGGGQRTATVATIRVGAVPVRVYSVHLATPINQAWRDRVDQMEAILEDAEIHRNVVIGGDLNSKGIGRYATERGYAWPTEDGPRTVMLWRWDHIFVRGLPLAPEAAAGTVLENRGASDHRPVWARAVVR